MPRVKLDCTLKGRIPDDNGQTREQTVRLCREAGLRVVQTECAEKPFCLRAVRV